MYGKIYPSLYSGSMVGAGPMVFALWPYVIANARPDEDSLIDLNPTVLAAIFGASEQDVSAAIEYLCRPDPKSRTNDHEGKRLIQRGPMSYFVVNLEKYRFANDPGGRREYWREYKRKRRQVESENCPQLSTVSTVEVENKDKSLHADADADADAYKKEEPTRRFKPPTQEEAILQASKMGLPRSEAEKFVAYYDSKGWLVGKTKMRSWIRAMAGWKLRYEERINGSRSTSYNNQSYPANL